VKIERFFLIGAFIILAFVILFCCGCSSTEHRREQLEREHPECFVFHDLTIECPNPFDSNAGFGTEVKNQKIKKRKK
jgi:hypothetical protein